MRITKMIREYFLGHQQMPPSAQTLLPPDFVVSTAAAERQEAKQREALIDSTAHVLAVCRRAIDRVEVGR